METNNQSSNSEDNRSQGQQDDQAQKTAADFDQTVREAEADTRTAKPGQSQGGNSQQHNNGRGGGK